MDKARLDVAGEKFILNSQIDTNNDQISHLNDNAEEFVDKSKRNRFELDKLFKEVHHMRNSLESELRNLNLQEDHDAKECYDNTMYL